MQLRTTYLLGATLEMKKLTQFVIVATQRAIKYQTQDTMALAGVLAHDLYLRRMQEEGREPNPTETTLIYAQVFPNRNGKGCEMVFTSRWTETNTPIN